MILRSWLRNVSQILFSPRGLQSGRRRRRCYPYVEMLGRRLYLTNPTVSSINLLTTTPTSADQVTWRVTFSQSVFGVDPTDFSLARGSTVGSTLI